MIGRTVRSSCNPSCPSSPLISCRIFTKRHSFFRTGLGRLISQRRPRRVNMATEAQQPSRSLLSSLIRTALKTSRRSVWLAATILISFVLLARTWRLFIRYVIPSGHEDINTMQVIATSVRLLSCMIMTSFQSTEAEGAKKSCPCTCSACHHTSDHGQIAETLGLDRMPYQTFLLAS